MDSPAPGRDPSYLAPGIRGGPNLSSQSLAPKPIRARGSVAARRVQEVIPTRKQEFPIAYLNSWRIHRQWLDRPFAGRSLLDVIRATGWVYSPGCSTPYLSLWARTGRFRPASLDRLVFRDRKLIQLETLRGCTMLVPREQAAVALRIRSRAFTELAKQARSLMPVTDGEMERLKRAVTEVLESGPGSHADILKAVPAELVRPFPPSLRRLGLTGSLRLAINLLKEEGRIVKLQSAKRLDTTEYSFALVSGVLPEVDLFEFKTERANAELAQHYFAVEGPARIRDFAWWAGINVTEAMRAAEEVRPRLVPVPVAGSRDKFLIGETLVDEFRDFRPSGEPSVNLIPYRDTYLKGQREIVGRFVRQEHFDRPFARWKGKLINDPLATVVSDGQVVGIWEWSGKGRLEFLLFDEVPGPVLARIEERAAELERFIGAHLGAFRLQGLDYGKNQMTAIHQLRDYWGHGAQADVREPL